ncbi:MAG: potassium channel family protein [Pseudomonadota bacterium]
MFTQLTLGTIVTVACVMFHIGGLVVLLDWLNRITPRIERQFEHLPGTFMLIVAAVLGIIFLHTIEVWSWALLYMALGEFESLTRALYFSVATATTVGYGDIVLTPAWQLLSTFEAMSGFILFGASTAFLFALVGDLFKETPSPVRRRRERD